MKKITLVFLLSFICSSSFADSKVLRAIANDGSFKFVASESQGVYKSSDGKVTIRCKYFDTVKGIDDDASPYTALSFNCDGGKYIMVKYARDTDKSTLGIVDNELNLLSQTSITIQR